MIGAVTPNNRAASPATATPRRVADQARTPSLFLSPLAVARRIGGCRYARISTGTGPAALGSRARRQQAFGFTAAAAVFKGRSSPPIQLGYGGPVRESRGGLEPLGDWGPRPHAI